MLFKFQQLVLVVLRFLWGTVLMTNKCLPSESKSGHPVWAAGPIQIEFILPEEGSVLDPTREAVLGVRVLPGKAGCRLSVTLSCYAELPDRGAPRNDTFRIWEVPLDNIDTGSDPSRPPF